MLRRKYLLPLLSAILFLSACQKEVIPNLDYKTLGISANDLLASSKFSSLNIEISYMPGYALDTVSLNHLLGFLKAYINKPEGIRVAQKQVASSHKTLLTLNDLVQLEKTYRSQFTGRDVISVHILIADAAYSDTSFFSLAYWNTSFCLFGKNIFNNSGGPGQISRTNLVSTLLEHEFGHLLGLVGQGSPTQTPHKDPLNGAHCNNVDCLMYYTVETITSSNYIPTLDADCIADLKANGGK